MNRQRLCWVLSLLPLIAFTSWQLARDQPRPSILGQSVTYWLANLPIETHQALLPEDDPLAQAGPEVIPLLVEALEKSYSVRDFLNRHRGILPQVLQKRLPNRTAPGQVIRAVAAFRLGQFGSSASNAVPSLIALLRKPPDYVRDKGRVIQALGFIGPPANQAVPVLVESLKDTSKWIRHTAAYSLLQIGVVPAAAIPALKRNLEDTGHVAALMATALLAAESSPDAISRIESMLSSVDQNKHTREHVAAALGFLKEVPDELKPILTRMMEEDDRSVRQGAAIGLAAPHATNLDRIIEVLVEGLKQGQFQIQCAEALGRIGAEAARARPELEQAPGYVLKNAAARALAKIPPE
jgi:hypothetical protein